MKIHKQICHSRETTIFCFYNYNNGHMIVFVLFVYTSPYGLLAWTQNWQIEISELADTNVWL